MSEFIDTAHEYLTFTLADDQFALTISQVREVLDCTTITHVPRMPAFLRGVINLRGSVVPVVDLRLCLGMPASEQTVDTCIVIVELALDGDVLPVGVLTDAVEEVIEIEPEQIKPAAQLGQRLQTDFIRGMARREDSFVIILDIDRVLGAQDLVALGAGAIAEKAIA